MMSSGTPIGLTTIEPTDESLEAMFSVWWIGFLSGTASAVASCLREAGRSDEEIRVYASAVILQAEANKGKFFAVKRPYHNGEWEIVVLAPEIETISPRIV